MEKITAVIVDDEHEARFIMESLLSDFSDIHVLARDDNVNRAVSSICKYNPDLVFLDIDMPRKNGFDLVREIKELGLAPTIIFVTAYNQYAIEAIKHAAFDYLVKPIDIDDLKQSIERYKVERKSPTSLDRIENLLQALQKEKLKFTTRTGYIFINPAEIVYCQADGNYTDLHMTNNEKQTVTLNIGRLENILPNTKFSKINRKDKKCILKVNDDEISFCVPPKYISSLDN